MEQLFVQGAQWSHSHFPSAGIKGGPSHPPDICRGTRDMDVGPGLFIHASHCSLHPLIGQLEWEKSSE